MPPPRNRPIPRFAPESSITLITALDMFEKAVDPGWTGEEIKASTEPEPSDERLANVAFARITQEAADDPGGEIGDDHPTEQQILDALHTDRDMKFAERRRWKSAALELMRHLHQGRLTSSAMGSDGKVYDVPAHLWASENAEDLFDNGGCLEIRSGGQLAVPRGFIQTDNATILVIGDDLQRFIAGIKKGDILPGAPALTAEHPDQYRTGLPGRPTISHLVEREFRRRATAGECHATLRAEAEALSEWARSNHPNAPRVTARRIETLIRHPYNTLVRRTK